MSLTQTGPLGTALREALIEQRILVPSSVDGVWLRSGRFEAVVRAVEALAHRAGESAEVPDSEPLLFLPPVMPRDAFVKTDYLRSFPDLIGSIETFQGGDAEHAELVRLADAGEDWTRMLQPSELTLSSAACHTLYPSLAGALGAEERRFEVQGTCFRHEPSLEPTRMQSFRMHEFVYVGSPDGAIEHRDTWLERTLGLLTDLGLPVERVVANDPFFGRAGRMLARNQRGSELKYEIVCPVNSVESPTAIASANYHLEHFGHPFDIRTPDGEVAHSSCFGFGLERITLALMATHGVDSDAWPAEVRGRLWP